MNKHHHPWWSYVKAIIRAYPGQMGKDLSRVETMNYEAVKSAIEATERMENGAERMKVIRLLHWAKPRTLTLDGAALSVPCDRATAARWQRSFFEEVAQNRNFMDKVATF